MPRFRPRFSLLSALLAMTIAGMAIVVVQLWREVGPLRKEVRQLRDEVGWLSVEDTSKIHGIQVRTDDDLTWKWRVWVPEGVNVAVNYRWGEVPRSGFPRARGRSSLGPGEHFIALQAQRDRSDGQWMAKLKTPSGGVSTSIQTDQHWFDWQQIVSTGEGVGTSTVAFDADQKILLARRRAGQFANSTELQDFEGPTAGFIIWIERR